MADFNVENIDDFDLDGYRQEMEEDASTSIVAQVNLWYLNSISRYLEIVQKELVLKNKPGTCPLTCIYNRGFITQKTASLYVDGNGAEIVAWAVVYPLFGEIDRHDIDIADIEILLDTGDVAGLRSLILTVIEAQPDVNKTALVEHLTAAALLTEVEYTPGSWATLQTAVTNGTAINNNVNATQIQVNSATIALSSAISGLVIRADFTALGATLTTAGELDEDDYTPVSWTVLASAVTAGTTVYNNLNSTQTQVNNAEDNITAAISQLVVRANKASLVIALNDSLAFDEEDYTTTTWAALATAVSQGIIVNNNLNATQGAVDTATTNINTAISGLVLRADFTALSAALADAAELDSGDYTPATWSALQTAVTNGTTVLNNVNSSQSAVNTATTNITTAIANLITQANRTALNAILADAAELSELDYTPTSWSSFQADVTTATTINGDVEATQQEVDDAVDLVEAAIAQLVVRADFTALLAAIATANGLNEEDYSSGSWSILQTAVSAGVTVSENADSTQGAVDTATTNINDAVANLESGVDKSALVAVLADASELEETDYTPATWSTLQSTVTTGTSVNGNPTATQIDVDNATTAITNAITALVDRANFSALLTALNAAGALDEEDYTPNSWATLEAEVTAANVVYNNLNSSQSAVDDATTDLNTVVSALVLRADKTALIAAIASVDELDEGDYTIDSWTDLETAVSSGTAINSDLNATQTAVNNATTAITDAIDALEVQVNKTPLVAALATAAGLEETDYTPTSWSVLQTAVSEGTTINNDGEATQTEVDDAVTGINTGISQLLERADTTALSSAISTANGLEEEDYTPETWGPLATAVSDGSTVLSNLNATQMQVDTATGAITTAISNLEPVEDVDIDPLTEIFVSELSYRDLILASVSTGALNDANGYVGVLGGKPSTQPFVEDFIIQSDVNESGTFTTTGEAELSPHALIGIDIPATESNIVVPLTAAVDLSSVVTGDTAVINGEIFRVVETDDDECTLARGCADTLPAEHTTGDTIFFYNAGTLALNDSLLDITDSVEVRVLPRIGSDTLDPVEAAIDTIVVTSRQSKPYPPAQLRVNGELPADRVADGELTLAWVNRNRISQGVTLVDQTAANVAIEGGVGTRVTISDLDDNVIRVTSNISGNEFIYTTENVVTDGYLQDLKITVDTHRGAVESAQKHEITVARHGLGFRLGRSLGGL